MTTRRVASSERSSDGENAVDESRRAFSDALVAGEHGDPGAIERLLEVMRRLRAPEDGCPWDVEQTFESIAPYTIEEAYEVADAIARKDLPDLKDELGDLLLQVVYHARIAEERAAFAFSDVVRAICDKMVRRHPHVFGDAERVDWEGVKAAEKAARAAERGESGDAPKSILEDVPVALPALTRAEKLQKRAARVGFDWPDARAVLDKIAEEAAELTEAAEAAAGATPDAQDAVEEEFGDLLFVMANLARHLRVDPETALRRANQKFMRRFGYIEAQAAAAGRALDTMTLDEMEALWDAAKRAERAKHAERA